MSQLRRARRAGGAARGGLIAAMAALWLPACPLSFESPLLATDALPSTQRTRDAAQSDGAAGDGAAGQDAQQGLDAATQPDAELTDDCKEDCGACAVCMGGRCVPLQRGRACGGSLSCAAFVRDADSTSGLECWAYQGTVRGTCSAAGECVPPSAASCVGLPRGRLLAACDRGCGRPDHNCVAGMPVSVVSVDSLCALDVETAGCGVRCNDSLAGSAVMRRRCDSAGRCALLSADGCGYYLCDGAGTACRQECSGETECVLSVGCSAGQCVP